ncbi:MAG TPA: AMP-binding protein [Myxococcota bacterium]|nr:AMP-binding protein [Myxococcota bacterium]
MLGDLAQRELVIEHEHPLSGEAFERLVSGYARWLVQTHSPRRGDRVAFLSEVTPLTIAALVAHLRLGLVHVPVPPRYTPDEVAHIVDDCGGTLVRPAEVGLGAEVELVAGHGFDWPAPPEDGELAWLIYTSGTTGRPKGVMMTHRALAANLLAITGLWEVTASDRVIASLPLFHVHGLGLAVLASLMRAASIILISKFSAERVVDAFRAGATVFMGVPTMYHLLLEHLRERPEDGAVLRAARLFTAGSAALSAAAFREFERLTGHAILERYGMTETGFTLSNPYRGERRPGFVGLPVPGVEVRLVDEGGSPVGVGEPGEIQVRGDNLMVGYWGRPDATAASFRDGWFMTGDTAVLENGHVRIVGRTSTDIIKTGGFKVGAREVEDVLMASGLITECAVLGVEDARWGEVVAAVVVPGSVDLSALEAFAAQHLADYKRPRRFAVVESLPRNALGKVQKAGLKGLFGRLADGGGSL